MASLNSVNITGRLTKDVDLRTTTSGKQVANITIAVDGWQDNTSFIDCVLWGRTAEIAAQYLSKGSMAGVSGRLEQRTWEKDGQKRSTIEVIANDLVLLGSKQDSATPQASSGDVVLEDISSEPISLDSIPF